MKIEDNAFDLLRQKTIGILGYGNQGRVHALNLRDSGLRVEVGLRPGKTWDLAQQDGFKPAYFEIVAERNDVLMFLLPDEVIPTVYQSLLSFLKKTPKFIGFAHGFAYHYKCIEILKHCSYFIVAPKGPGYTLRDRYLSKDYLPGALAVGHEASPGATKPLALAYAKAVGLSLPRLVETTFAQEAECDLFGEQTVLCGGMVELMRQAFELAVQKGMSPEMAFYECCYEARAILDLILKHGPAGMVKKVSPTACYGGATRGRRLINEQSRKELVKILDEIQSGAFAKEWLDEVKQGRPTLNRYRSELSESLWQKGYEQWKKHDDRSL